jgi:hypothetical protein
MLPKQPCERWGEGTVQCYDGDQLTVLFDKHGYRDLLVPLVLQRGLLRPASNAGSGATAEQADQHLAVAHETNGPRTR